MKKNKGITLIALVITIIVLLILAGVTVATLTGENGLLGKASTAGERNNVEAEFEQIKLATMSSMMEGTDLKVNVIQLRKELKDLIKENPDSVITENAEEWTVTGKKTGTQYTITKSGTVEIASGITLESEKLTGGIIKLSANETAEVKATLSKELEGKEVKWTAETEGVVTLDTDTGLTINVTTGASGSTVLKAYIEGTNKEAKVTIKVIQDMSKAQIDDITVERTKTTQITIKNEDEIEEVDSYSSNKTNIATVDENGTVTGVAIGTATITITGKSTATKTVNVEVTKLEVPEEGDYVDYTAGNWTVEDMELLGVTFNEAKTEITSNGSMYSNPCTWSDKLTFSGFTCFSANVVQNTMTNSKDQGIIPRDDGGTVASGWRILSLNSNGTIKEIIHAGTPEEFNVWEKPGDKALTILLTTRNWSMYVNNSFAVSARCPRFSEMWETLSSNISLESLSGTTFWLADGFNADYMQVVKKGASESRRKY